MTPHLVDISIGQAGRDSRVPAGDLAEARGVPTSKRRLLERYFMLETVLVHQDDQPEMLFGAVAGLVRRHPDLRRKRGTLLHVRTQTHATHAGTDWLRHLASRAGLPHWEVMAQTQTHCAGGLVAVDLVEGLGPDRPAIILTGEKAFHPITANQPGAVLGEAPAAALIGAGPEGWAIRQRHLRHAPQFHDNPHRMAPELRRDWERGFATLMQDFIDDSLARFRLAPGAFDLVVPYNLNLPLLQVIAERYGWQDRIHLRSVTRTGHLFCADVFHNLAELLPGTKADRILCFAAGMGATFAALVLERSRIAIRDVQKPAFGRNRAVPSPN
ncbi:MAG: 3-oxoacyl-[acyl-carrier-protein] synthase III C-terminal domain-containing protein [Defluviimonas denitrificans]